MSDSRDIDRDFARAMLRAHEETINDPEFPESLKSYYREQREFWREWLAELDAKEPPQTA